MAEKKKWYAVYTRHRWEKKVFKVLEEKGVEAYCPLNKIQRKWSDRMRIVEEPLFKSYIFVKVNEDQKTSVRMTHGVMNFVYWLGKPAVVKEREIETIKKFLNEHENVEVEQVELEADNVVQINSGIFMHKEAKVLNVSKNTVRVVIESIGFALIANLERKKVTKIKNKP